jgi:DNA mismatch repair ATPase MutS
MQTTSLDEQCNHQPTTGLAGQRMDEAIPSVNDSIAGPFDHPTIPHPGAAKKFHSILFEFSDAGNIGVKIEPPAFFRDLNLDQIVDAITAGREEYNLKPFFYTRLTDPAAIGYRQEIMRDLESAPLFEGVQAFAERLRQMRRYLSTSKKESCKYAQERWLLDAVDIYCSAVMGLQRVLEQANPGSFGLCSFREYLKHYTAFNNFQTLRRETERVKSALSAIRYGVRIHGGTVTVSPYAAEMDYTVVVEKTFAKFKQGAVENYLCKSTALPGMNHVEAAILDRVARLHPEAFDALDEFYAKHEEFLDETVATFDREIQFYVAFMDYAETFKRAGLKFCYPQISDSRKDVFGRDTFDLSLAAKLIKENSRVVGNDFSLSGPERVFVVTGPNQGGKTTFARTFGQLHHLAGLGCPVAGSAARLFLADQIFTHFEREEDITTLRGKLQDDLVRMHHIFERATPNSLVIINEIFSSTSVQDAVRIGRKVFERLSQLDALCVCVTFLDELAAFSEKTVSAVAGVLPEDATRRTFKIERRPADGLAYALAIAEKYQLTYHRLKARLKS